MTGCSSDPCSCPTTPAAGSQFQFSARLTQSRVPMPDALVPTLLEIILLSPTSATCNPLTVVGTQAWKCSNLHPSSSSDGFCCRQLKLARGQTCCFQECLSRPVAPSPSLQQSDAQLCLQGGGTPWLSHRQPAAHCTTSCPGGGCWPAASNFCQQNSIAPVAQGMRSCLLVTSARQQHSSSRAGKGPSILQANLVHVY